MLCVKNYVIRKPILPIEAQICSMEGDSVREPSSDLDIDVDEVVIRMKVIHEKIFENASDNIKKAQTKYKSYYDKQRQNPQVCTRYIGKLLF